jgi:IS4 transposase
MRLRDVGDEDGEGKEVKMMGQLLRGARVRQVWDLHDGQWVRFAKKMVVQLVTEADMRVGVLTGETVA